MLDYRGIDKQDVLDSLHCGEAFLRSLNLGPATTKELDDWVAGSPYAAIQAATNREELAHAVGGAWPFMCSFDLLRHHALVDTNGVGLRIFEDIARWGAFDGARGGGETLADTERDAHLVVEYTKILAAQGPATLAKSLNRLTETVTEFAQKNSHTDPQLYADAAQQMLDMIDKGARNDAAGVAQDFLSSAGHIRYVIETALCHATGLDDQAMTVPSPFERYGIPFDCLPADPAQRKATFESLKQQINMIVMPLFATGETLGNGYGAFGKDHKLSGLFFEVTRPVVQGIVDQFPQFRVVDSNGVQIMPTSPAPPAPRPTAPFSPKA